MHAGSGGFDGDETLIRRTAAGQRPAFDRLVERHQASVYRFALSLASDEPTAEEAVREAFVSAWRSASRFRGESSARIWLFTLARRTVEKHGPEGASRDVQSLEELVLAAGWGAGATRFSARLAEPSRLRLALWGLPPRDRALLILRDLEGLSHAEAADVLGLTEGTLRTRLHRARLRLVAGLRQAGDEPAGRGEATMVGSDAR